MNLVKRGFALHVVIHYLNHCDERGINVVEDLQEDIQLRLHDQSTSMTT
jgi:hypothetical protein